MDEASVAVVKNQLAALESGIKRVNNDLTDIPAERRLSRVEVKTNITVIDGLYDQACTVLLKLEGHSGPLPDRRAVLMKAYVAAKCKLEALLQELEPAERQNINVMEQTFQQQSNRGDHLPRIDLPQFNGSPTEWLSFKGRFEKRIATIGEDADKFAFLSKCLEQFEPAKNSIEALENAGTSFAEAWQKLETRFYKRRVAFEGYFSKLLKVKKTSSPNAKAILGLIDAVDTTVHAAHQIQGERQRELDCVADGLIIAVVKSKLDDVTISRLEESLDLQKVYTWAEFKAELEKRANQLACQNFDEAPPRARQHNKIAAVTAVSQHKESTKKVQPHKDQQNCFACGTKGHSIFYCAPFNKLSVSERWEAATHARRCYNCLSWGHSAQKCPSKVNCKECGAHHHTLLHQDATENPSQSTQRVAEGNSTGTSTQASASTSSSK